MRTINERIAQVYTIWYMLLFMRFLVKKMKENKTKTFGFVYYSFVFYYCIFSSSNPGAAFGWNIKHDRKLKKEEEKKKPQDSID